MKNYVRVFWAVFTLGLAGFAWAEVVVIVHPSAGFDSLSEEDVSRLFLGKSKNFPSGALAVPVNQDEGKFARETFNQIICNKNSSQYKAYWSRLVFTGKGTPPSDAGDDSAVKALISANPNMIGYIDASAVDATVKVVYKIH